MLQANALSDKYERKVAFQLWSKKDGLMLRSDSAPMFAFSSLDHGLIKTKIGDDVWHVFSMTNSTGEYIIHVGQKEEIRAELTDEISSQLVTQFLIGLPFLGIVIWFIVGLSLKPSTDWKKRSLNAKPATLSHFLSKGYPMKLCRWLMKSIISLFSLNGL